MEGAASTHRHPLLGDQNLGKTVTIEEIVSKIEESRLQAADAAVHAASAVSHCQAVWNQLEMQKISDDEANIVSSAASIAAAACIAKVAVAAAKIASNVAEQARSMANEVFQSRTASYDQSSMVSRANVIPNFDKATPASILKSADGGDHSTSIISAAREAARRRIKAASAASKHAENLDAILKAAELAAEAVSQTRKIVAMGNPTPLMELIEAGPKGYRKTNRSFNQQCDSDKQNVEAVSNDKEIHILEHGLSPQENSRDLSKNKMMINNDMPGSVTNRGNDKSAALAPKNSESSKPIGVIPAPEFGSIHTSDVSQDMPQSTSDTRKENNIKEGCLVEVCKDDNMNKRAWFAAKILTLKDEKAFVCYNEIQSDEGHLKEWIPLEVEGVDSPRIRLAHPISTKQSEGTRKRGRKAMIDYDWCSGDRVDVWVQDSWCEATVLEANKTDLTSLTVQFHGDEEKSVVRLWHVRPSLIWKDGEWIEWSNVKGIRSSEGDTPHEKRRKFGSHDAEGTEKVASSDIDLNAQKERSGVVFGVPSPGKKQKFMDVTKHYVANGYVKKNKPSDSGKLPRAQGHRELKNNSKNDVKEKQVAEIKPKLHKPRKPPIPRIDGNPPGHQNRTSNKEDAITAPCSSSDGPERLNKRKFTPGGGKPPKVEVKNKSSTSEAEPRRSNRKIQPTSRLLEGLQSSLTMTKIPSFSSQRSHNNVTSKGTGSGR